jgi:hypothetical protein
METVLQKPIPIKSLTPEDLIYHCKEQSYLLIENNGGELFQHEETEDGVPANCLLVDLFSLSAIVKIYNALNEQNKVKFAILLHDEYKLARFLDSFWDMIKVG